MNANDPTGSGVCKVTDREGLLTALREQETTIIIAGDLVEEIRPIIADQPNNLDKDLNEFAWRGAAPIAALVRSGVRALTGSREESKLSESLMNYEILINTAEEIILQNRRD